MLVSCRMSEAHFRHDMDLFCVAKQHFEHPKGRIPSTFGVRPSLVWRNHHDPVIV
ncbi:hypothetical protein LX86_009696 [Lentzea aerocolonigenes]|nr:hypothetical protein [Lentzea aerocolonigenes]